MKILYTIITNLNPTEVGINAIAISSQLLYNVFSGK